MSEARALLDTIIALRQQLEQARALAQEARSNSVSVPAQDLTGPHRLQELGYQVRLGTSHTWHLDAALRRLTLAESDLEMQSLPSQLTSRARRLLEKGRELIADLRKLADQFALKHATPEQFIAASDPLEAHYRDTIAMTNTALRMIPAFPDAPSAQMQLCEGLEVILKTATQRLEAIRESLSKISQERLKTETLAQLLQDLLDRKPLTIEPFLALAEPILVEAQEGKELRFLAADPRDLPRFVACHSMTVARVLARVVRFDSELRAEPLHAILAGLLHDAGMLTIPAEILANPGPLNDEHKRLLENHARAGAEMMVRLHPQAAWLEEAAASHHEKLDGTGYPAGLRETQLSSLCRLVGLCSVYGALCADRPYRPAFDTRIALTDTLLLADRGELDRFHAEKLMLLSAYPIGALVELADGAIALVVATHSGRRDAKLVHARPVLSLLTDSEGKPVSRSCYLDLAECEHRSIVRSLSSLEKQELLQKLNPLCGCL
jgi:HD-GYP domain-containing protein (c-di-GMP phosphodiesterase class II)